MEIVIYNHMLHKCRLAVAIRSSYIQLLTGIQVLSKLMLSGKFLVCLTLHSDMTFVFYQFLINCIGFIINIDITKIWYQCSIDITIIIKVSIVNNLDEMMTLAELNYKTLLPITASLTKIHRN